MAICDVCLKRYVGGALPVGSCRVCSGICQQHGAALALLDHYPPADVGAYVEQMRSQNCPLCGGIGPLGHHEYHEVRSYLILTKWSSQDIICCRSCGAKQNASAAVRNLLLGWWGIPWGLFVTPGQIVRNVAAILRPKQASERFTKFTRFQLAQRLAKSAGTQG